MPKQKTDLVAEVNNAIHSQNLFIEIPKGCGSWKRVIDAHWFNDVPHVYELYSLERHPVAGNNFRNGNFHVIKF